MALDSNDISIIKGMLARGDRQSDIAAFFGCNGGRIAEINKGQRGSEIRAASAGDLPPPGPYLVSVRSAMKARETLLALRGLVDDTLAEITSWEKEA